MLNVGWRTHFFFGPLEVARPLATVSINTMARCVLMNQALSHVSGWKHRKEGYARRLMSKPRIAVHFYQFEPGSPVFLLGPEVLLPSQYEYLFARREHLSPVQRLMAAVLESAVYDLQRYRHARRIREKRFFREAYEWFTAQDDKGPFSFIVICEALDLDPDYLRAGVLAPDKKEKEAV